MLATLDDERAVLEQQLAAGRESQPLDLDHDPAGAGRLQELEAEGAPPPREVLELARSLAALLLEPPDLGQLRLRLLRLRLLVPKALHESLQPLDVVADPLHRLRGSLGASRAFEPPLVPRPGEVEAAPSLELEHSRRHRLEEPAVVRDQHDRGVDRRQLALEPLEALDIEVVRRLVEEKQVGVACQRAREGGAGQLSTGERGELPVEIVVAEAEAAEHRRGAVAPAPAARMLEPRLRLAVAAERCRVVRAPCHRLLEIPELLLDLHESCGAGDRVFAEREAAVTGRALIVQCDARALLECDLAALDRRFADQRAQKRRLAAAVLARERQPLTAVDRERDAVEERVAGELLAQVGGDQDGHRRRVDAGAAPRVMLDRRVL